ncbi:MAG: hypothetical protein HYT98_03165 [Candidatus Sungbacteria bacterium]|nr:hypothetical protein [Candidatus Sungbacteria bacterium]
MKLFTESKILWGSFLKSTVLKALGIVLMSLGMLALFGALFLFASRLFAAEISLVPKCVPFSMSEVPDETRPEWKFMYEWKVDDDRTGFMYEIDSGFHLGVWYHFGKLAHKAWACDASENNGKHPLDKADHMISIFLEDGTWSIPVYAQRPERMNLYAGSVLSGYFLYLRDKDGNIVAWRTIERPK